MELFVARLLTNCFFRCVKNAIDKMEKSLGTYDFLTMFGVCLTDRRSEFENPVALETVVDGIQRTSIYYCDPMRSNQKGGIEEVYTLLRMILPKGTVFEHLIQWDVRKCVDHINSYPREKLEGMTPYMLVLEKYDLDMLRALQLKYIEPDTVNLTPSLLK